MNRVRRTCHTAHRGLSAAAVGAALLAVATGAQDAVPDLPRDEATQAALRRNPFWPVGYDPAEEAATPPTPPAPPVAPPTPPARIGKVDWDAATRTLDIRGVTALGDGRAAAIINGQVVVEGDRIELQYQDWIYAWRVGRVRLDNVELTRLPDRLRRGRGVSSSLLRRLDASGAPPSEAPEPQPPSANPGTSTVDRSQKER